MEQRITKRNHAQKNFSEEKLLGAIQGSGGIIATIAKRLSCSWPCAQEYLSKYPACLDAIEKEREIICDVAEDVLFSAIRSGDVSSAKWLLARMRPRLYSEKYEISAVQKQIPELTGLSFEELMELKATLDEDSEPKALPEAGS